MINKLVVNILCLFVGFTNLCFAQNTNYEFEDLGKPIRSPLTIEFVTNEESTGPIAWGAFTDAERNALIGVHVKSGRLIDVDLSEYGKANALLLFKQSERYIYLYAGRRGRFFKYDVRLNELKPIGEASEAAYWMKTSFTIAPDGQIYVGTYPRAAVSVLDPRTEEVKVIDKVSETSGSEYVINPASDKDGTIYFPTGMKHGELWSYNPVTKQKKQILPKKMMTYGAVQIWRASDGNVYGRRGNTTFLCTEDKIVAGEALQREEQIADNLYDNVKALYLNIEGGLVVENQVSKEQRVIESDFEPSAHEVFSIGDIYNGKLYGSGMKPGHIFTYDINTGEINDLGKLTRGNIQTYDILVYEDQLFMSSYTGGYIDVFQVDSTGLPIERKNVAHLHREAKQERLVQLTMGVDGHIYSPTMPIKGFLGGTLVRVNPKTLETKIFRDLVPNQSLLSTTVINETGELFLTTTIQGGSSAKPVEKEAVVIMWDPSSEKVTYTGKPIKGARSYGKTVSDNNGLIYGTALDTVYVFDPLKKEVVYKATIEEPLNHRANILLSESLSQDGLVYGIDRANGLLVCVDTDKNAVKVLGEHQTLKGARFAEVKEDGYLYYPNHYRLMRVKVTGAANEQLFN